MNPAAPRKQFHLKGIRPYSIHITAHEQQEPGQADYALLLVHGTAGHGGCYDDFASAMSRHGVDVFALDLVGHGLSGGERGIFTMDDFLADVDAVSESVAQRTDLPVVLLGASQGGEIGVWGLIRKCE